MLQRIFAYYRTTPVAKKISHFTLLATLVFLGDASLSYFVPNYIENTFQNSFIMGLVISTSSLVGLAADLVLPQLMPRLSTKKALLFTTIFQLVFISTLLVTLFYPQLWLFFLAMACWGLYFEFLTFSTKIFVTKKVPHPMNSIAWANIMFGRSLSYVIGPIFVTSLIFRGNLTVLLTVLIISLLTQLVSLLFPVKTTTLEQQEENIFQTPKLLLEIKYWKKLTKTAWPALIITFLFSLIDAAFWTIGTVLAIKLENIFFYAFLFLPLYVIPMIFAQLILMKKAVGNHKERLAALFLLLGAITLSLINKQSNNWLLLLIAFTTGFFSSLAFTLTEAANTDLEDRMGIHRQHLIGFSNSLFSLGYIVGPFLAGLLSSLYHEQLSFSIIGMSTAIVSLGVLIFAPKRAILPQKEMQKWTEDKPNNTKKH